MRIFVLLWLVYIPVTNMMSMTDTIALSIETDKLLVDSLVRSTTPLDSTTHQFNKYDTLLNRVDDYFDYTLKHWCPRASARSAAFKLRVYKYGRSTYSVKVDTDLDGDINNDIETTVKDDGTCVVFLSNGVVELPFEIRVAEIRYLESGRLGGIEARANYVLGGSVVALGWNQKFWVVNSSLGTRIYMKDMTNHLKPMSYVELDEKFFYKDSVCTFSFMNRNKEEMVILFVFGLPRSTLMGYRKGSFVDLKRLDTFLENRKEKRSTILYFWGGWCYPCVVNMKSTMNLYHEYVVNGTFNMYFVTCNYFENHSEKSNIVIDEFSIPSEINLIQTRSELMVDLCNYKDLSSLSKLFRVQSYPTYIIVNRDGLIVYRDNEFPEYDILEGLSNVETQIEE